MHTYVLLLPSWYDQMMTKMLVEKRSDKLEEGKVWFELKKK